MLQAVNMLLPLVTFPYIIRIIGVEYFGLLNVVLSIVLLFNIFIEFGFNLSATKEISVSRNDINKVSKLFFSVLYSKFLLLLVSGVTFFLLFQNVNYISENILLFYMTSGLVIGNLLFPSWFFQGVEQMRYITIIIVVIKIIATIGIFVFITEKNDFLLLPLINSVAAIISGLVATYFAIKKFKLIFYKPNFYQIKEQLKSSYHFFLSRVANQGSRHLVITMVGANFGNVSVGYYAIADKLYMAIMSLGGVVSQTLYPHMSAERDLTMFRKIFKFVMLFTLLIVLFTAYFQEYILFFVFNLQNDLLSDIFMIFMISVPFGIISQLIGYPLLAAFGFDKHANNSLIYSAFIYLITVLVALYLFQSILLVALCVLFYQIIGVFLRLYYINNYIEWRK